MRFYHNPIKVTEISLCDEYADILSRNHLKPQLGCHSHTSGNVVQCDDVRTLSLRMESDEMMPLKELQTVTVGFLTYDSGSEVSIAGTWPDDFNLPAGIVVEDEGLFAPDFWESPLFEEVDIGSEELGHIVRDALARKLLFVTEDDVVNFEELSKQFKECTEITLDDIDDSYWVISSSVYQPGDLLIIIDDLIEDSSTPLKYIVHRFKGLPEIPVLEDPGQMQFEFMTDESLDLP